MHMFCLHYSKLLSLELEIRECSRAFKHDRCYLRQDIYDGQKTKLKEAQLDCLFPLSGQEDRNDNYAIRIISLV
jgi:hypothetical protein